MYTGKEVQVVQVKEGVQMDLEILQVKEDIQVYRVAWKGVAGGGKYTGMEVEILHVRDCVHGRG